MNTKLENFAAVAKNFLIKGKRRTAQLGFLDLKVSIDSLLCVCVCFCTWKEALWVASTIYFRRGRQRKKGEACVVAERLKLITQFLLCSQQDSR